MSVYEDKCRKLKEMRDEYRINPNPDLYKKIYDLDKQLKEIDSALGQWSHPGGSYKPNYRFKASLFDKIKAIFSK
jgi:hypothetical protein